MCNILRNIKRFKVQQLKSFIWAKSSITGLQTLLKQPTFWVRILYLFTEQHGSALVVGQSTTEIQTDTSQQLFGGFR